MKTRLLTAAVGIPLALAILIASAYLPAVFYVTFFVLCMIGIYEALKATGANQTKILYVSCFLYGAVVMISPFFDLAPIIMPASLIFLFVMFGILLKKHDTLRIETLCTAMILTMFVAFPFMVGELIFGSIMSKADGTPSYAGGVILMAYCVIVAWVADGGAYFIGRAFGKHKLAPVISPKKTIEGAVGGFVTSIVISPAVAYLYADVLDYLPDGLNYVNLAIISAVCIIMSMFGDISFSAIKRQYGVKDFGNLLPGHGGVLDRFDSVLFVCPTFYLLNFVLPILK